MGTVLINTETQGPEIMDAPLAAKAIESGTHQVPLVDPEGNPVSVPYDASAQLIAEGYKQPTPGQLQDLIETHKFEQPLEQAKTFGEGALDAATFGLSGAAENALFNNAPERQARAEINPGMRTAGQVAGLVGSQFLLPGGGTAGLMTRAGELGAEAAGLGTATLARSVGSGAIKGAIETAVMQGGDEVAKALWSDPDQSIGSAISDVGLAAALGGGFGGIAGSVSPLWKAVSETKVGQALGEIKNKLNGSGAAKIGQNVDQLAERAGIKLSPEIRSALSENPDLQHSFATLMESSTGAGKEAQASFKEFQRQAQESALSALGKTTQDVAEIASLSDAENGQALKDALIKELKLKLDPTSELFNKVSEKFKNTELPAGFTSELSDRLSTLAREKYGELPNSDQFKALAKLSNDVSNLKTLEGLRQFQSVAGSDLYRAEMYDVLKSVRPMLRESEDNLVSKLVSEGAPELSAQHQAARSAYRSNMQLLDELNDSLHVGSYGGPGGFLHNLKENVTPETVLNRLSPRNNAGILKTLQTQFPITAQSVRDNYINKALKVAAFGSKEEGGINLNALFKHLDKNWTPEMREFAMTPGAFEKLQAVKGLMNSAPEKLGPSGTPKGLIALLEHVPASAGGMLSSLMGHNPVLGYAMGQMGKYLSFDLPDAMKLSVLKYVGHNGDIDATGFKLMHDYISKSIKGVETTQRAVNAVFDSGKKVLPTKLIPTEKDHEKLEKSVEKFQMNPGDMVALSNHTGSYLPEHGAALATTAQRAAQVLAQAKPKPMMQGPLDKPMPPSKAALAEYKKIVDVVQQPLVALERIKDGTITPKEVAALQNVHPGAYRALSNSLINQMSEMFAKDKVIPYHTKIALGVFLARPLDGTMTPNAITSSQMSMAMPQMGPQQGGGGPSRPRNAPSHLDKLQSNLATPLQRAASTQGKRD